MQKFVDVRDVSSEDRIELKLSYGPQSLPQSLPRVFSFHRLRNEPAASFRMRMKDSIYHKFSKKLQKKRKEGDAATDDQPVTETCVQFLDCHKNEVDYESLQLSNLLQIGNSILIDNQEYTIRYNVPTILKCNLPDNVLSGFPIYPLIECEFCKLANCKVDWYIHPYKECKPSENSKSWQYVFTGMPFVSNSLCDKHWIMLKVFPPDYNGTPCEPYVTISNSILQKGPIQESINKRILSNPKPADKEIIRILSYNILADLYSDSDYSRTVLFPYCPPEYLAGSYRQHLILKETLAYQADIICLQEVDSSLFAKCLDPCLESLGFFGFYNGKAIAPEGQATFFSNRFEIVRNCSLKSYSTDIYKLKRLHQITLKIAMNDSLYGTWIKLGQSAGIYVVRDTLFPDSRPIIVANSHLYFSPDANDLRLLQIITMMEHIDQVSKELTDEFGKDPLILIAADLNSNERSTVYKFLSTGKLDINDFELLNFDSQPTPLSYRSLVSAYSHTNPQFTNYTPSFHDVLDHIFVDTNLAQIRSVVPLPSLEEVSEKVALPNEDFPSDHLPLIVDFQLYK